MAEDRVELASLQATVEHVSSDTVSRLRVPWYASAKRPFDFLLGVFLLLLTSPLQALIAMLICLDSPGAPLFRQHRVGQRGKIFTIYKFRTMRREAPAYTYKVPITDPTITRTGKWLRRTGLDELPQLWNVVRGDMALIGPRPELPFIVDQYRDWQHLRHSIRPGMTGWWQVNHRNEIPMHLNIDYDLYYLKNISLRFDLEIMWRTIRVMLRGLAEAISTKQMPPQHPAP